VLAGEELETDLAPVREPGDSCNADSREDERDAADGEADPPAEEGGTAFGWYLRCRHDLIRRHVETLKLHADYSSADWELAVDLELPTDDEAYWKFDGKRLFPFPLLYLRKAESRIGLSIYTEKGVRLPVPIREECDHFSTLGATTAARMLGSPKLKREKLEDSLRRIIVERPYHAAMVLQKLREEVGLLKENGGTGKARKEIGDSWHDAGLDEMLQLFVEHSLIWVPLWGRPGERRTIWIREEKSVRRRAFIRWAIGELKTTDEESWPAWGASRRQSRALAEIAAAQVQGQERMPRGVLPIGGKPYGRRRRTISLSALGERIGRPLAWMPFEFEFPTIYTLRCSSYHFELRCPPSRSPRDLRVAGGSALAEPSERHEIEERRLPPETRKVLTGEVARLDIPASAAENHEHEEAAGDVVKLSRSSRLGHRERASAADSLDDDVWLRITVGIGDGAFPILWFLVGAITAAMLWFLADANPNFEGSASEAPAQITAAILLVVPALIFALAVGSNEVPVSQLIGGARILLLVSGLSAVAAAAVIAGLRPFQMSTESAWALCAIAATAATVPLGTSWLLSRPMIWVWLKRLNTRSRQKLILGVGVGLALLGVGALQWFCTGPVARGAIAVYLLGLPMATSVVGNDRAAMKVNETRNYLGVSFLAVGFVCLVLGSVELRMAIMPDPPSSFGHNAEIFAIILLISLTMTGYFVHRITRLKPFRRKDDEIHVSPEVGQEILAMERVRELDTLRKRELQVGQGE